MKRPVATFPAKPSLPSADACPDIERHTACPPGYVAWQEWAERMSETHEQEQCPTCGYWAIWRPREDLTAVTASPETFTSVTPKEA